MLKRQRPASPPPSIPSIPLATDPLPFNPEAGRASKRRRVLPPSLDGHARGWSLPDGEEDDGEEDYMSSGDEPVEEPGDKVAWTLHLSEYKMANNFLHELHALHQHRLLFSSPPVPNSRLLEPQRLSSPLQPAGYHRPTKTATMPTQIKDPTFSPSRSTNLESHVLKDEELLVTERYKDTNRSFCLPTE